MKTIAFLKSNKWMGTMFSHGDYNGYVAIPPTNKYYGKHYDEVNEQVSVHGGLTFSEPVTNGKMSHGSKREINPKYVGMRHNVLNDVKFLNGGSYEEIGDDWWIFGFDTNHFGDNEYLCDIEYCVQETLELQKQLEK